MSVKLTNWSRDSIVSKFVHHTFGAKLDALVVREGTLARNVYNSVFSLDDQKKMNALPNGWLPVDEGIQITARGYSTYLHFFKAPVVKNKDCGMSNYNHYVGYETENLRITNARHRMRYDVKEPELLDSIHKYIHDLETFKADRLQFVNKMKSFLKGISTSNKLFELMPEANDILGDGFFGTSPTPSTALTTTANEILCVVANVRGEKREGCCEGQVIAL